MATIINIVYIITLCTYGGINVFCAVYKKKTYNKTNTNGNIALILIIYTFCNYFH